MCIWSGVYDLEGNIASVALACQVFINFVFLVYKGHCLQSRKPGVGILSQTWLQVAISQWRIPAVVSFQTLSLPKIRTFFQSRLKACEYLSYPKPQIRIIGEQNKWMAQFPDLFKYSWWCKKKSLLDKKHNVFWFFTSHPKLSYGVYGLTLEDPWKSITVVETGPSGKDFKSMQHFLKHSEQNCWNMRHVSCKIFSVVYSCK